MLLGYMLPEVHSLHTTSLTEHRHGKNELSLLVILLVGLWHSVGEDFTSQLAAVCDAVYHRPQ